MFEYEEDEAGQDYVVIEKRTVEINSLADGVSAHVLSAMLVRLRLRTPAPRTELDAASQRVSPVTRRRSSRSLLSRPLSALTLSRPNSAISGSSPPLGGAGPSTSPQSVNSFALSITPPFAISSSPSRPSPLHHMHSHTSHTSSLTRPISIPHSPASYSSLSGRPTPQHVGSAGSPLGIVASAPQQRYGSSPSSGGVLARAISLASARLFGGPTSASIAAAGAGVVARASARRKALIQSGEADPAEESLINQLEDLAQKAFVVFEFADTKIGAILSAASGATSGLAGTPVGATSNTDSPGSGSSSGFPQLSQSPAIAQSQAFQRRRSSFNSTSESEVSFFRLDVVAAEALALYLKSLAFLQKGMEAAKNFWQARDGGIEASADLNEGASYLPASAAALSAPTDPPPPRSCPSVVQWFRARFNDCSDKAEFARGRCTEEPADVSALAERLLYEKAMELVRCTHRPQRAHAGSDWQPLPPPFRSTVAQCRHPGGTQRGPDPHRARL
jgi:serine/threonine-protein kinase ULK/ATG1